MSKGQGPGAVTTRARAKLDFVASPSINNCGKATPLPLMIKIVQVADPAVMAGTTQERLWNHERVLLNPLTEPDTLTLSPGGRRKFEVRLVRGAKAVVVLGGFCMTDPKRPTWFHLEPWKGSGNLAITLRADATCFTVSKR